ncbi:MAG: V-type ATP synthase subunit I [Thermoplasmata archaeon]|nr:MAG: V-type ATP synthase subunit I [Thermoplasmata archaeon]
MLFPEKMVEVSIIVHKQYFDSLLMELHETGWLEIFDYKQSKTVESKNISGVEVPIKRAEMLADIILNANRLRDILKKMEFVPPTLYQSLKARKVPSARPIAPKPISDIIADARKTIRELDYIFKLDSELSSLTTQKNHLKLQIEKLQLFKRININLRTFEGTPNIAIKVGRTTRPEDLKAELTDTLSDRVRSRKQFALYLHQVPDHLEERIAVIIVPQDELINIRKVMVGRNFKELELKGFEGTPNQVIAQLKTEIENIDKRIIIINDKLGAAYNRYSERISILIEELEISRNKTQILSQIGQTADTYIICGWCLERQLKPLQALCDEVTSGHVSVKYIEPGKDRANDVPVKLRNPKWAQPFEMLTTTFAYPKYNEIDPTVIIAPLFILFFAIMLGDAGYGMVLLAVSIFGFVKFRHVSITIQKLSSIGIYAGIVTIIIGILMGAFFGDLIPRYFYGDSEALLYSLKIGSFYLPYDSFRNPMLLFIISLIVGLFILNLGLVLGAMQNIQNKKFKELISSQLAWFVLQPPAVLLIGQSLLKLWVLSDNMFTLSIIMLIAGLLLMAIKYRTFTTFEIFGFLGDWMSFARLLALSLATMGVAFTINLIGELLLNSASSAITFGILAVLVGILLFLAHLINFLLQTLGAAIHALRLQYIELFNRCYEGGGAQFQPFQTQRYYTKLRGTKL